MLKGLKEDISLRPASREANNTHLSSNVKYKKHRPCAD